MQECAAWAGAAGAAAPGEIHRRHLRAPAVALAGAVLLIAALVLPHATVPSAGGPTSRASGAVSASASLWAQLPPLARLAISRGVGDVEPAYWAARAGSGLRARNEAEHLSLRFGAAGVTVSSAAGRLTLSLRSARADGRPLRVAAAAPAARANRVSYARGAITEWYSNGPLGLEQGFTISSAAAAAARRSLTLSIALHAGRGLRPRARSGGVDLIAGHRVALRYGGLRVVDASGRTLPAWMIWSGGIVALHVRTAGARFPLIVDPTIGPIVQQGTLVAADGAGGDGLGQSVAISGSTIAVGAPSASAGTQMDAGAVYVFTEPSGGWASSSGSVKLTASAPQAGGGLGTAVAISGDTVVAGAPNGVVGAGTPGLVYLFNKPASGWASTNESGVLTEPGGGSTGDDFGQSVSAAGGTVVVGAPLSNSYSGQAFVYTEPAGGWASEPPAATLTTTAPGLNGMGFSVATDGSTIVAGAPLSNSFIGQLDVFSKPPGGWANATQSALLNSSAGATGSGLGQSVAVFGGTVVGGAPGSTVGANSGQGAVYVYDRPASGTWADANESAMLTASNGAASDALGDAVAISGPEIFASAPAAMIGANAGQGAVYVFSGAGATWAQSSIVTESMGNANDVFGSSVAISGPTLAVGADGETGSGGGAQGAAFAFGGVASGSSGGSGSGSGNGNGNGGGPGAGSGGGAGVRNYATVLAVSGGPDHATVTLKCLATTKCVAANAELVVEQRLAGNRVVASYAKVKVTLRRVVIGAAHVTLAARQRMALVVSLNPTGRRLLGSKPRMAVGVSVTSVGRVLRLTTATITRPAPSRTKSRSAPSKRG